MVPVEAEADLPPISFRSTGPAVEHLSSRDALQAPASSLNARVISSRQHVSLSALFYSSCAGDSGSVLPEDNVQDLHRAELRAA